MKEQSDSRTYTRLFHGLSQNIYISMISRLQSINDKTLSAALHQMQMGAVRATPDLRQDDILVVYMPISHTLNMSCLFSHNISLNGVHTRYCPKPNK